MGIVWDINVERPEFPQLTKNLEADFVVVGLGGSGLTALLHAAQRGLSVIGIDADRIAAGAAGRNGGLLLAGIADFHHNVRNDFGVSRATALYQHTLDEMDRIEATTPEAVSRIGALRIGELQKGEDSEELSDTYAHRDALIADGFPVEDYEGEQGIGILIPTDGTFHPAKRAVQLAKLATTVGAKIFTHSPAIKIESGLVTTDQGSIKAKHVVVAVDGNLEKALPEISELVQPTRLQMISTAPETKLNLKYAVYVRQGWDYWQQLPDGRIAIGGGRDLALDQEATDVVEPTQVIRDYLERKLESIGVTAPVEHHWAAIVSYTDSGLPIVKEVQPGVWAVGAYCGTGNVVGALLARSIVDQYIDGHSQAISDFAS
ncbi:MAG: FAD-binding oxidoreductase [Actinobacteria bacterium]|nr:FAD-binding oxidoreductase [Actinomycetota bacterium]NBO34413.1 FAD-binding oxidoreductase [Actinomycetota bacterium]